MPAPPSSAPAERTLLDRVVGAGEWTITLGLAAVLIWTTMCLGGYLAEQLLWSARALWALGALGAVLMVVKPRPIDWRVWLPVPFLVFALASVLWIAPARWLAWREWQVWLQMWIVFALALHFGRSRAQTWTLVGTILALALTGVVLAAYQRFVDPKWIMLGRVQAGQFWTRSAGMFGIPNSLAQLLEFVLPGCLVLLGSRTASIAAKILCSWLAVLCVCALAMTGSRGGWIGAAASLALWPLLTSRTARKGLLGGLAVLVAVALGLVALYQGSAAARERIDPMLTGEFEYSRPIMWRGALQIWQRAPWLGTGAASYNVIFDQVRPRGFREEPDWPHNDYVNTLSDYGVVGFSLWFGTGAAVLLIGWRTLRAAKQTGAMPADFLGSWRWRLACWLALVAFVVHLVVEFHTKIPALAYLVSLIAAWCVREGEGGNGERRGVVFGRPLLAVFAIGWIALLAVTGWRADRMYRSEALRFDWRRKIDRLAQGVGSLDSVLPPALVSFEQAVKVDPDNGRAWGDYAYGITLSWHLTQGNMAATGRRAQAAAERSLALCPLASESWITLGTALDLQGLHQAAGDAFRRGIALAPNTAEWHYYYAHHLGALPGRRLDALAAVETCLALDPSNAQAKSLRARLTLNR